MKKIFLFILLPVLFQINLNAEQTYRHCLDEGMVRWSFLDYHIIDLGPVSTELVAYGDTLIHDRLYKKMYVDYSFNYLEVEESNANWKNHSPDINRFYQWENIFIRESEDASQLYLYDSGEEEEYLISDLNLEEGDEYRISYRGFNYLVDTVDSVYLKEGLKHIQLTYKIDHYFETLTFIEGVGPSIFINPWYDKSFVNCFQNQSFFYKRELSEWYSHCFCGYYDPPYAIEDINSGKGYNLVVENDRMKILPSGDENLQIAVYDISGRLCYRKDFPAGENVIVPRYSFPKGVYLLKIFNKDNSQAEVCKIIL